MQPTGTCPGCYKKQLGEERAHARCAAVVCKVEAEHDDVVSSEQQAQPHTRGSKAVHAADVGGGEQEAAEGSAHILKGNNGIAGGRRTFAASETRQRRRTPCAAAS